MEWKIEHLKDAGIIKTVVSGSVSLNELKILTFEQLALAKQLNVNRFLSVYQDVDSNISMIDIHEMPHILKEIGQTNSQKFAILYSTDSKYAPLFRFFDDRCSNTTLNSRVFSDYDTAYQWLINGSDK